MNRIVVKKCNSYDLDALITVINKAVDELGGWDNFIKPKDTVLLKVNLIGPKTGDSGAVTHPEFVRAIVRILREKDCRVWIGDSAGGAIAGIAPTGRAMNTAGYTTVAEQEGAEIKNFDREGVREIPVTSTDYQSIYLARPLFEADAIINLPKLKTHVAAGYTGAVKNLYGCIPGLKKAEYHKLYPDSRNFGKIIADINDSVKPVLHIMDGIVAMQGKGPTGGKTYSAGKVLAGTDPLALDTIGAAMIGLDVRTLPIFEEVITRNLGAYLQKNIEIKGDYTGIPLLQNFEIPRMYSVNGRKSGMFKKVIDFFKTRPKVNPAVCTGCNTCVDSCPVEAIDRDSKLIDYSKCIECLCCHELCVFNAIELKNDKPLAAFIMRIRKTDCRQEIRF